MAVICVTGPMAAGKNTITGRFAEHGWLTIDADAVVHDALEAVTPAVIEAFDGEGQRRGIKIAPGGVIDRRALGRLLFASPELLSRHEAIVLPEMERETLNIISSNHGRDIVLNAISLYKTARLMSLCSLVVYVTAPVMVRLMRVRRRDGLSYTDIAHRFYAQRGLFAAYQKTGVPIAILHN